MLTEMVTMVINEITEEMVGEETSIIETEMGIKMVRVKANSGTKMAMVLINVWRLGTLIAVEVMVATITPTPISIRRTNHESL